MTQHPSALSQIKLVEIASGKEAVEDHVLELLQTLQDDDEERRAWANDALQTLAKLPRELAPAVAPLCLNEHAPVASWACTLLSTLGEEIGEFQTAIVDCLDEHPSESARQQAALALSRIPCLSAAAKKSLQLASQSSDPRLQRLATAALHNSSG